LIFSISSDEGGVVKIFFDQFCSGPSLINSKLAHASHEENKFWGTQTMRLFSNNYSAYM